MVRRLITVLFVLVALALALHPLYASEPPFAPFATCADGKCVMSEADYNAYRAWHFALLERMQSLQRQNADLSDAVGTLQAKLVRNAYCEGHHT